MKLEFMRSGMDYLRPVYRESRLVEDTAESIVPDSCPDAVEVLHTSGVCFLRGKELSDGLLSLSAGVSASAVLGVEGRNAPEVVEVYIPMSLKLEDSSLSGGQNCRVSVELRRLDGHLVNPRKVMVRAAVRISVWVYGQEHQEHLTECLDSTVQILKQTAPIRCLQAMGEKNYTVEDRVSLVSEGEMAAVAGCQIRLRHTDTKLTGTRGVFRGTAGLTVLYLDEAGKVKTAETQLPFSQYIDLGDCQETDELCLTSHLTGADVTPGPEGALNVTLQLLTVAEVWGKTEIGYIGDMYSICGNTEPEWQECCHESLLDRQHFAPVAHGAAEGAAGKYLFSSLISGDISSRRNGESVTMTLPVTVYLLYEEETGALKGGSCRVELEATTQAAENCRFECVGEQLEVIAAQDGAVNVKVSGEMTVISYGTTLVKEIVGAELTEEEGKSGGPGLIIRRPKPGETLWLLAKDYRTTQEAIARANGLEGQELGENMLLIPSVR